MVRKAQLLALAIVGVTAVSSPGMAQQKIEISIAHPPVALHLLPIMVAEDRGYFAAEGLKVQNSFMAGGSAAAAAMMGGSVDATSGAMARAVLLRAKGIKVKLLNAIAGVRDWAIVVDAKRHAGVTSVAGLKGLKIATPRRGSDGDQIINWIVRGAGMKVGADVSLVQIGGFNNHLIAIQKGDVDGSIMPEPFGTTGVRKGVVHRVLDLMKGEGPKIMRNRIWTGLLVKEEFLQKRPEVAAKMTRAIAKAVRAIYADHDMAIAVAAKRMPTVGKDLLAEMIPRRLKATAGKAYLTAVSRDAIAAENEYLAEIGRLKSKIAYEDVIATDMAKHW
jgi:NitT/TauT family transport system substrate-binding protein